jgi:hypothetical protein
MLSHVSSTDDGAQILPFRRPASGLLREPRDEVATYRIKVDLEESQPPIWRHLEIASDLTLDVLHRILQVAMGWTESHLHGFSLGGRMYEQSAQRFAAEYDLMEGDDGTPEADVRLDQVLQDPGDVLFYEYDFGDSWYHVITLEGIEEHASGAPFAKVVDGERACPPEDVGGVQGYVQLLQAYRGELADSDFAAELLLWAGPDLDPDRLDLEPINSRLRYTARASDLPAFVPKFLADMLEAAGQGGRPLLEHLVARSDLDDDTRVPADVALRMTSPLSTLLSRVGPEGVKLTSAGYLPPAVVVDLVASLRIDEEWIGTNNREYHTIPVLELRESARLLGLIARRPGKLVLTPAGRRVREDPVALWEHIASRLPIEPEGGDRAAAVVRLLMLAADAPPPGWSVDKAVEHVSMSLGWAAGRRRATAFDDFDLGLRTENVLERLSALPRGYGRHRREADEVGARLLARAALRSL